MNQENQSNQEKKFETAQERFQMLLESKRKYSVHSSYVFNGVVSVYEVTTLLTLQDKESPDSKDFTGLAIFAYGKVNDFEKAALQSAQTISFGRALAMAGFTKGGQIASEDEINMVANTPKNSIPNADKAIADLTQNLESLQDKGEAAQINTGAIVSPPVEEKLIQIRPDQIPPGHVMCIPCFGTGSMTTANGGKTMCPACNGQAYVLDQSAEVRNEQYNQTQQSATATSPQPIDSNAITMIPELGISTADLLAKEQYGKKELETLKSSSFQTLLDDIITRKTASGQYKYNFENCPATRKTSALKVEWILFSQTGESTGFYEFVLKKWEKSAPGHSMVVEAKKFFNGTPEEIVYNADIEEAKEAAEQNIVQPGQNLGPQDTTFTPPAGVDLNDPIGDPPRDNDQIMKIMQFNQDIASKLAFEVPNIVEYLQSASRVDLAAKFGIQ